MASRYVADASVVVKWLNQEREPAATQALRFLEGAMLGAYTIVSSDLLPHEVFNALIRGKGVHGKELEHAVETFFRLPIEFIILDIYLVAQASLLAEKYSLTFYDAVYLAIAHDREIPLVTANIKHQGRAPGIPVIDIAQWSDPK